MGDAWTLALGITGTVLGILNTWLAINRDRIRLRVRPVHIVDGTRRRMFGIEVTNLSGVKLYVDDVGFTPSRFLPNRHQRASLGMVMQVLKSLESRESYTFMFDRDAAMPTLGFRIAAAYAKTSCGRLFTGVTPAVRQLAAETVVDASLSRT